MTSSELLCLLHLTVRLVEAARVPNPSSFLIQNSKGAPYCASTEISPVRVLPDTSMIHEGICELPRGHLIVAPLMSPPTISRYSALFASTSRDLQSSFDSVQLMVILCVLLPAVMVAPLYVPFPVPSANTAVPESGKAMVAPSKHWSAEHVTVRESLSVAVSVSTHFLASQ